MLCETQTGWKSIQEFNGVKKKLELQEILQKQLQESACLKTDLPVRSEAGELTARHTDGRFYVVREWYPGKECDTRNPADIRRAARTMALMHRVMSLPLQEEYEKESLVLECGRHNAEIRKICKYLAKKQRKNEFEKLLLQHAGDFLQQGESAVKELEASGYEQLRRLAQEKGSVCHGEYTQHHVLNDSSGKDTVIHLERWNFDLPTADLALFMRKILEKHNWDRSVGQEILTAYERENPLTAEERRNLFLRLSYPWKYWKLANHYYGSKKAWISGKDVEKLERICAQKKSWRKFIKNMDF